MTDISETPGQTLPEYLRYEDALTLPTGIDAETLNPFVFPEDPDEETLILFKMSQRQFTAILSSVDTGSIICYGAGAMQVYWWFLRNVEMKMSICEAIIDCITNDIDTQQAVVNMLMGNQTFNNYLTTQISALTTGQITEKIISGDCDESNVFGRVKAMVDRMSKANTDLFEKIEAGTNDEEKLAALLESIPILGELPIGDVLDFSQDILEDFAEFYDAQVDEDLLQLWYCGLYCKAMRNEDCSLTYGDIFDFFQTRVTSGLTLGSGVFEVVNFIVTGDFSAGTRVADGMMALQSGLIRTSREFMGMTLPTIAFATRDAVPSSGWEDCDVCPDDDFWLLPVLAGDTIDLVSFTEDTQTWDLMQFYTGNYLTGGAISANGQPFYITDVDYDAGEVGAVARFVLDIGTYALDSVPCFLPTTKIWAYEVNAGATITVTIARLPCQDLWLKSRTDGDFGGLTTFTFVGRNINGDHVWDITSSNTTGANKYGIDTVEEDLSTLKGAYLRSAIGVGSNVVYHYHEQAESIGDGDGRSGTVSSKKWMFVTDGGYGSTIRVTFSTEPY